MRGKRATLWRPYLKRHRGDLARRAGKRPSPPVHSVTIVCVDLHENLGLIGVRLIFENGVSGQARLVIGAGSGSAYKGRESARSEPPRFARGGPTGLSVPTQRLVDSRFRMHQVVGGVPAHPGLFH